MAVSGSTPSRRRTVFLPYWNIMLTGEFDVLLFWQGRYTSMRAISSIDATFGLHRRRRKRNPDGMDVNGRPAGDELTFSGGVSARAAFDRATSELRMEGVALDAEAVPELVAYRDGTMTISEACESMSRRHARN